MAEEVKAGQKFFMVEKIDIFSSDPERLIVYPHIGPRGLVGDWAEVRAKRLECLRCADSVFYDKDMISVFMRWPLADCVLKDGVLTCERREKLYPWQ